MEKFDLKPQNEEERLQTLENLKILDTEEETRFEDFVDLACALTGAPIALISLVDKNRQWFKAKRGLDVCETDRNISFCTHVVYEGKPLIIENALQSKVFHDNPLVKDRVVGAYAGFPIKSKQGLTLGTLCIIDSKPRVFEIDAIKALEKLSKALSDVFVLLELDIQNKERSGKLHKKVHHYLEQQHKELDKLNIASELKDRFKTNASNFLFEFEQLNSLGRLGHSRYDDETVDLLAIYENIKKEYRPFSQVRDVIIEAFFKEPKIKTSRSRIEWLMHSLFLVVLTKLHGSNLLLKSENNILLVEIDNGTSEEKISEMMELLSSLDPYRSTSNRNTIAFSLDSVRK